MKEKLKKRKPFSKFVRKNKLNDVHMEYYKRSPIQFVRMDNDLVSIIDIKTERIIHIFNKKLEHVKLNVTPNIRGIISIGILITVKRLGFSIPIPTPIWLYELQVEEKCNNRRFYHNGETTCCELPKGHKTKWHQITGTGIYGHPYKLLWRDLTQEKYDALVHQSTNEEKQK